MNLTRESLPPGFDLFFQVFSFALGASVGSFLNVVIARLPEDMSIVSPASRCPKCLNPIAPYDNVPVLSWLFLLGRCRKCRSPISIRYPVVELIGGMLGLACYRAFGPTAHAGVMFVFVALLVAITYIDLDHWIIPSELTNIGLAVGIGAAIFDGNMAWSAMKDRLSASVLGAVLGFGVFALIAVLGKMAFKKEALGQGDWWLLAMIGGFLGWQALLPVITLASLQGSVIGGLLLLAKPKEPEPQPTPETPVAAEPVADEPGDDDEDDWEPSPTSVPFGPFLALGALEQLFVGDWLLGLYDRLAIHLRG